MAISRMFMCGMGQWGWSCGRAFECASRGSRTGRDLTVISSLIYRVRTMPLDLQPCFTAQVLMPNGAYKGQKLITLVTRNTAPRTSSTKPTVPVTVPVK